jgi:hypothetical protein
MNKNKIVFFSAIFGAVIGLTAGIGIPLIVQFSPQNLVWMVMGVMGASILLILILMISLFFSKDAIKKFAGFVLILPLFFISFYSLIVYKQLAPLNAPYYALVENLDTTQMLKYFAIGKPILMLIIMFPLIIWALKFMYATYIKREEILKQGISCQAKILKIADKGLIVNDQPVFTITLEVNSPSQGVYQVTKDFMVPHMDLGLMQPGTSVNVKVDPSNSSNVVFDTWTGEVK